MCCESAPHPVRVGEAGLEAGGFHGAYVADGDGGAGFLVVVAEPPFGVVPLTCGMVEPVQVGHRFPCSSARTSAISAHWHSSRHMRQPQGAFSAACTVQVAHSGSWDMTAPEQTDVLFERDDGGPLVDACWPVSVGSDHSDLAQARVTVSELLHRGGEF